jgi:hypothetical protein
VEPITIVMLVIAALLVGGLLALGGPYPGSGAEQLRWRPTRSPEADAQGEIDDLEQLREAVNAKRRARGRAELTDEDLRRRGDGPR